MIQSKEDKKKEIIKILIAIGLFVFLLVVDLLSKYSAAKRLTFGEYFTVIPKILTFTYSENRGASFGIFANKDWILQGMSSLIAIALTIFVIIKWKKSYFLNLCLVSIISGAVGNLYDRFKFGYVRDFIDYTIVKTITGKQFAICNFADAVLTVGCILLVVYIIFIYKETPKEKNKNDES